MKGLNAARRAEKELAESEMAEGGMGWGLSPRLESLFTGHVLGVNVSGNLVPRACTFLSAVTEEGLNRSRSGVCRTLGWALRQRPNIYNIY